MFKKLLELARRGASAKEGLAAIGGMDGLKDLFMVSPEAGGMLLDDLHNEDMGDDGMAEAGDMDRGPLGGFKKKFPGFKVGQLKSNDAAGWGSLLGETAMSLIPKL